MDLNNIKASKPFLRWAGGKLWLTKKFEEYSKIQFNRYFEPFLGGGAIFFHLRPQNAILSDLNHELITTYIAVKDQVEELITELKNFENTEEFYYQLREITPTEDVKKAARFIYLNQTSFNGIYRVNLKGQYNVPYGYRNKPFLDENTLRLASNTLQKATLQTGDFQDTISEVQNGDLVFLDPPYTVTHNNNGFIKYNSKIFDLDAQIRLSQSIDLIKERGAYYILTNAAHKIILEIFERSGDRVETMSRASLVGGNGSKRGQYQEFLFTNI